MAKGVIPRINKMAMRDGMFILAFFIDEINELELE